MKYLLPTVIVVACLVAGCGSTPSALTPHPPSGAEVDAGPLRAHLGGPDGQDQICDPSVAVLATNAKRGVSVVVSLDGPANVDATLHTTDGKTQQRHAFISVDDDGEAKLAFQDQLKQIQTLTVAAKSEGLSGTCYVIDN